MKRILSSNPIQLKSEAITSAEAAPSPVETLQESLDLLSDNIEYVLDGIELSARNNPGSVASASKIVADLNVAVDQAMQAVANLMNE